MKVTIKFFASLREKAGADSIDLDLADGIDRKGLLSALASQQLQDPSFLTDSTVVIAINQEICKDDFQVSPGDEIAFLPPITGG